MRSIIKSAKNGNSSLYPVIWINLGGDSEQENEVGRVTCGHEHTLSFRSFVNWTVIALKLDIVFRFTRSEPEHWAWSVKDLCFTLNQRHLFFTPSAALEEHTYNIDTIIWWLRIFFIWNYFKIIIKQIDGNVILSSIILFCTCQETLSEEESSDPHSVGDSLIKPFLHPI